MKFNMDSQTYTDLNVFSSSSDTDALFNIFKLTSTIGGREKIHEMMYNPVADINVLNSRKETIKYYYDHEISLKLSREQLDLADHYLNHNKTFLKRNMIDSIYDFASHKLNPSNDYYIISVGISSIIKVIRKVCEFLETIPIDAPEHLQNMLARITTLLVSPPLKESVLNNPYKLSFYQISKLDSVFRGTGKQHISEILQCIYELDAFETLAYVAKRKGFSFPDYVAIADVKLELKGLFHPSLENPISNDVTVNNQNNMVFLTGSNMAGKSSLLKSIGISIYLAHIGFPVPCAHMKTTIFNGLMTTINLPDNINQGLSHYYSEVKRVKQAASLLNNHKNMFIIFDELFRGTNVKDAYDGSLLIISALTAIRSSAFFISTHIVELAEELKKFENIAFKYLDVYFEDKKPVFTYMLKEGVSTERLGMYIVQNEGIIELIKSASKAI
jgi:DNA mismatch repair protein MutS